MTITNRLEIQRRERKEANVIIARSVCPSVCPSVTLVNRAKAFSRDIK